VKKKRDVKVARTELVYDDDCNIIGERVKIVPLSEVPASKPGARYTGTDDLIAQYKQNGKVKDIDLVRQLALAAAESKFLGHDSVVIIRRDILHIAATKLFGSVLWGRAMAEAQKVQAKPRRLRWNRLKDDILRRKPSLSIRSVATLISEKTGDKVSAIRAAISPK
jgi:hypothetical protein